MLVNIPFPAKVKSLELVSDGILVNLQSQAGGPIAPLQTFTLKLLAPLDGTTPAPFLPEQTVNATLSLDLPAAFAAKLPQ